MKLITKNQEQGSMLVISLTTCAAIGIVLASYLLLLSSRYNLNARSMGWNAAMPTVEAGIEEALTHLQSDANNLNANSWTASTVGGQPVIKKKRTFADGSYADIMIYDAASSAPTIYSSGFVPAPLRKGYISRTVRVTTKKQVSVGFGILTKKTINLGSDFLINSYDDSKGPYNITNAGANVSLGTTSTTPGSLMIADSKIYGSIYSPPTGSYTIGSHGEVGDMAFVNGANDGKVQAGAYHNDLNATIDDVTPPSGYSSWSAPTYLGDYKKGLTSYTYNGVTYPCPASGAWQYVLTPGNYKMNSSMMDHGNFAGNILILGDVKVYVPEDCKIVFGSGNTISIPKTSNGSLQLYNASTTDAVMKDASNDSLVPSKFTYYGLTNTAGTKLSLTGSALFAFCGIINAPQQKVVLTGSSGGNEDFLGAIKADDFTMSGHTYMHFPESLKSGSNGPLLVASWKEL